MPTVANYKAELTRLRAANQRLRAERAQFALSAADIARLPFAARFRAIQEVLAEHPREPQSRRAPLDNQLKEIIREGFAAANGHCGYRRMTDYVNQQTGQHYNRKRIYRLMQELGLKAQKGYFRDARDS